MHFANLCG